MFEVHAFSTPNSAKVPIALEELGLPHTLVPVNIRHRADDGAGCRLRHE